MLLKSGLRAGLFTALALLVLCAGCDMSPRAREARGLKRASQFMMERDYARALLELKNAAQAMPKDAEPYYRMGLAYSAMGDVRSAAAFFRRATELNPNHTAAQVKLAEILTSTRSKALIQEASKRLESVLANTPKNNEANDTLAMAEWELGNSDSAAARLEQSLANSPADLRASIALARLKLSAGDQAGAEAILRKAVEDSPKSAQAKLALARFYWMTNRREAAEHEVNDALQLDPKNEAALEGLAAIQVAGHRMDEAEQTYKRLSALPDKSVNYFHAEFLFRTGKREAGLAELAKLAKQDPGDRNARTRLLAAYIQTGKISDAGKLLAAALKSNPEDSDALFQRAELYLRSGNAREAVSDLEQVLHFRPDSAQAHFALSEAYRAEGANDIQRQELNETLRLNPAMLAARLELASNFIAANEAKSALATLDQAPPQQRNTLATIVARNWALYANGDFQEMRTMVSRALASGRPTEIVFQDAVLKMAERDHLGARISAEEVLRHNPDTLGAVQILADSYVADKQPGEAIQRIQELIERQPKSARLRALLAKYYLAQGQQEEARQAYEAAKSADPSFTEAGLALAQMDLREKRIDSARQRLTNVLEAEPRNIPALLMLASIDAETGNRNSAIARCRAVLDIDRKNVFALNDLAWNLAVDDPDEALKYARQASDIAPDSPNVQDTLGWIYYRKGRYRAAVDCLKNAIAKQPTPERQFHLAMSYLKAGDEELGQKTLLSAVQKDPRLAAKIGRDW